MTIYGRSEELVSRCIECDLAEPESLSSLGGSAPGLVDGILSHQMQADAIAQHTRTPSAAATTYKSHLEHVRTFCHMIDHTNHKAVQEKTRHKALQAKFE